MAVSEQTTVLIGVFPDRARAEQYVAELKRAGFTDDQFGMLSPGEEPAHGSAVEQDAAAGALTGALPGAVAGAIAAGLIPGVGPVIAGGLLAGAVGGAVAGAAAGGALGALIGLGVPEEHAKHSEAELHAGRTLVIVKGRFGQALEILRRAGGRDASPRREAHPEVERLDELDGRGP